MIIYTYNEKLADTKVRLYNDELIECDFIQYELNVFNNLDDILTTLGA